MTDTRWQRACHELGHALADMRLGRQVRFVSIRDGVSHSGVASSTFPKERRVDLAGLLGDEVPLTDPRARGIVEAAVIGFLAGYIAEQSVAPTSGYRPAAPPEVVAAVETLVALRPRHRELLAQLEARPESISDEEQAIAFTEPLARAEVATYLEWLRAVAVRLVHEMADEIARIAPELVREEVIDGERLAALVRKGGAPDERAA